MTSFRGRESTVLTSTEIDYTRHYRKWHDDSETHCDAMCRHFQSLLDPYLPESKDSRILDVGCGTGFALQALREIGYHNLEGIDSDKGQAAAARRRGLAVNVGDALKYLQTRSGRFDLILCLDVIEHVPVENQLTFVAALLEGLADGASLICTVPNANSSLASRWRYIDWTHTSSFTEHSLDFLLFNAGFRNIRILPGEVDRSVRLPWLPHRASLGYLVWRSFRFLRRLEMMAEFGSKQGRSIPLSLNLMAIASR
jgi:SAM-dependent methyltransferase